MVPGLPRSLSGAGRIYQRSDAPNPEPAHSGLRSVQLKVGTWPTSGAHEGEVVS